MKQEQKNNAIRLLIAYFVVYSYCSVNCMLSFMRLTPVLSQFVEEAHLFPALPHLGARFSGGALFLNHTCPVHKGYDKTLPTEKHKV